MRSIQQKVRSWIKRQDSSLTRFLYRVGSSLRTFSFPSIRPVHGALYMAYTFVSWVWRNLTRAFIWTPMFRSQCAGSCKRLYISGGMPCVAGPLIMRFGDDCILDARTTISGRAAGGRVPELIVGNNVDIGSRTRIAVGRRIVIGNNVLIAPSGFLAGYPGHPLDPASRAAGEPDTEDQVGDIVLEDEVWLATGVKVMAGVRIGRGTVVAAGSVVTHDLPAGVLAGGVPARVIRRLTSVPDASSGT